jgi:hypothetical protein
MSPTRSDHHHHHHHGLDVFGDPHARLATALVLSLLLWAPYGMAVLRSDLDAVGAGIRYLVAFVGCRAAVGGIAHLLMSYRAMARTVAVEADEAATPTPALRADD